MCAACRLGRQCADGDDVDSLLDDANVLADPRDNGHEGGGLHLDARALAEFLAKPFEIGDCGSDFAFAGFDLESGPTSVGQFHDGVHFKSGIVAVIAYGNRPSELVGPGVHGKIAEAEVLENQPEGLPIFHEALGGQAERGDGQRGIGQIAFRLGLEPLLRAGGGFPAGYLGEQVNAAQEAQVFADLPIR